MKIGSPLHKQLSFLSGLHFTIHLSVSNEQCGHAGQILGQGSSRIGLIRKTLSPPPSPII